MGYAFCVVSVPARKVAQMPALVVYCPHMAVHGSVWPTPGHSLLWPLHSSGFDKRRSHEARVEVSDDCIRGVLMAGGGPNGELEEVPPIPAPPSSVRPDEKPQPRPGALLE